jgi:hypothetical protein
VRLNCCLDVKANLLLKIWLNYLNQELKNPKDGQRWNQFLCHLRRGVVSFGVTYN